MNEQQRRNTDFEERLLAQLQAVVAERGATEVSSEAAAAEPVTPAWRRGPRLALGGGDNAPAAFAVEPQEGGGVAITIHSLSEPEGVEQALEEAGVPSQVTYLAAGMACREPHYQPSMVEMPALPAATFGPLSAATSRGHGTR